MGVRRMPGCQRSGTAPGTSQLLELREDAAAMTDKWKHVVVETIDGVMITDWPNLPQDQRYTVLHPKCGVNIRPRATLKEAQKAADTHRRKCRG